VAAAVDEEADAEVSINKMQSFCCHINVSSWYSPLIILAHRFSINAYSTFFTIQVVEEVMAEVAMVAVVVMVEVVVMIEDTVATEEVEVEIAMVVAVAEVVVAEEEVAIEVIEATVVAIGAMVAVVAMEVVETIDHSSTFLTLHCTHT